MAFGFREREIRGVVEIHTHNALDERGGMFKEYDKEAFFEHGINFIPLENTMIFSRKNVLRGMHFQAVKEQDRLVRCVSGKVWAVVLDLRREYGSCGRWIEVKINDGQEVYVPKGCAFGSLALEDSWILCMYGGNRFHADLAGGIKWDDSTVSVKWPVEQLTGGMIVSDRDRNALGYNEFLKEIEF